MPLGNATKQNGYLSSGGPVIAQTHLNHHQILAHIDGKSVHKRLGPVNLKA